MCIRDSVIFYLINLMVSNYLKVSLLIVWVLYCDVVYNYIYYIHSSTSSSPLSLNSLSSRTSSSSSDISLMLMYLLIFYLYYRHGFEVFKCLPVSLSHSYIKVEGLIKGV